MSDQKRDIVSVILHGVASVALVVMMLVVVADVALRLIFNTPVRGAYDMVSVGLLVMVFFGIGPVIAWGSEILIDLFDPILSPKALKALRVIAALATVGTFGFIAWSMASPALDAWRYGDRSLELGIPSWTLWVAAFVGLVGIMWGAFVALLTVLRQPATPPHDPTTGEEGAL